jgi:putative FmdB family regulatory protein
VPLYEYRCKACGHVFEKIQSFSAPEEKECPVCNGEVERLLSAPAIQFKGAGWYVNDYAGKSAAGKAGSVNSGGSGSSGDSSTASTASTASTPSSGSASTSAASSSSSGGSTESKK